MHVLHCPAGSYFLAAGPAYRLGMTQVEYIGPDFDMELHSVARATGWPGSN